jgi:hypothetical protein
LGVDGKWKSATQMAVGKPVGGRPEPKEKKPAEDQYRTIS